MNKSLEIINSCLPIVSTVLSELVRPAFIAKLKYIRYNLSTRKAIMGLSFFIIGEWKKSADYFYHTPSYFKEWQVKYIMALGLSLACDDELPDSKKILYGNKASELLTDISTDSTVPEPLQAEILIRLGGIKKIVWYAKRQLFKLECKSDNELDEF